MLKTYFLTLDETDKTKHGLAFRDGVQLYRENELNVSNSDSIIRVYRSPATIANVKELMKGLPTTSEHIETDAEIKDTVVGYVGSSKFVDFIDEELKSTIALYVSIDFNELDTYNKKKGLSLGYQHELIKSDNDEYDYEQINVIPHHLAMVDIPRGGENMVIFDGVDMPPEIKEEEVIKDEAMTYEQFMSAFKALSEEDQKAFMIKISEELIQEEIKPEEVVIDSDEDKEVIKDGFIKISNVNDKIAKILQKTRQAEAIAKTYDIACDGKSYEQMVTETVAIVHGKEAAKKSFNEQAVIFSVIKPKKVESHLSVAKDGDSQKVDYLKPHPYFHKRG